MSDPTNQNGVVISIGQMYAELRSVHELVTSLHQKLDGLPGAVADHEARLRTLESYGLSDHDGRLGQLERVRWMSTGVAAFLSAALSSGIVAVIIESTRK